MPPIVIFAERQIEKARSSGRLRELQESCREDGVYVRRNGRRFISFSCNDYLGLSQNQQVRRAACDAIEKYGAGSGASRLITGNNPLYGILEKALADFKGTEAALVFGSGYLANIGVIPAFAGRGDLIIADKLVHASIIDGCRLSGAKLLRFSHNSVDSCANILQKFRKDYKNCLIITEHIFSMDGDVAPVDQLCELADKYDAWLITDDAHGLGTIAGKYTRQPHMQMGTLSKAMGSYGGYVCASRTVIDYLVGAARSVVYSTALPPPVLAASIAALEIIVQNREVCTTPLNNALLFTRLLGIKDAASPIVPLIMGSAENAIYSAQELEEHGFLVAAIRPPTVQEGTARLRFAFSALHRRADIEELAGIISTNYTF